MPPGRCGRRGWVRHRGRRRSWFGQSGTFGTRAPRASRSALARSYRETRGWSARPPQVHRDVRIDEPEGLRMVVVDVGDEDRREGGRLPGHLGLVEGFRGVEAGDALHQVEGEVVSEAESFSRLKELDEVLLAEVEWRAHVEPDPCV